MTEASLDFRRGLKLYLLAAVIDIIAPADTLASLFIRFPSKIDHFLQWIEMSAHSNLCRVHWNTEQEATRQRCSEKITEMLQKRNYARQQISERLSDINIEA